MQHIPNNEPCLWLAKFPVPAPHYNKYNRGYAVIAGGGLSSAGATKLAANSALRSGAGLVSVACDKEALPIYAANFQAVMTKLVNNSQEFSALIADFKVTSVLVGPACGITEKTKEFALAALELQKATVLDADALTVFKDCPSELFSAIKNSIAPCILTPHEGEFERIFGGYIKEDELMEKARKAAVLCGATLILKGFNTIIATQDGKIAINHNATAYLATAGSGDVLAGICVGLLAAGMPAFEAACAAVWLHAEAGLRLGAGLIAEDIAGMLPFIYKEILG
jgi:NAD(P)H-hydrate epimerase